MPITDAWHEAITKAMGGPDNYGKGVVPNPFFDREPEWARRRNLSELRQKITDKAISLYEPRFITTPPTVELLESLIVMTSARQVLELGMHTGFGTLHMLRAIVGNQGAHLTSVDARPAHDRAFFEQPEIAEWFTFLEGWTPECLSVLPSGFDFVFVDSDHSVEHSQKEWEALKRLTHSGSMLCWHDVPAWQSLSQRGPPPVRLWLEGLLASGELKGMILPSPNQFDCEEAFGVGYNERLNPGLAVTIRT